MGKLAANLLWSAVVVGLALLLGFCHVGCHHPAPRHVDLPSTTPVKRAVAVVKTRVDQAAESNARAVAIARRAVQSGIAAGSQDAQTLADATQATDTALIAARASLLAANASIDALTAAQAAKQKEVDAQTGKLAAVQAKYDAAIKTIWWYRLRFWGPLTFALLALVIYLLTRFTSWGARTFGPYILGGEKVAAKAAVLA